MERNKQKSSEKLWIVDAIQMVIMLDFKGAIVREAQIFLFFIRLISRGWRNDWARDQFYSNRHLRSGFGSLFKDKTEDQLFWK